MIIPSDILINTSTNKFFTFTLHYCTFNKQLKLLENEGINSYSKLKENLDSDKSTKYNVLFGEKDDINR